MIKIKRRGFTLIELSVVIIILGILATLSIAYFGPMKEKVLTKEAIANLKLIAAAEKIWRMESANNAYTPCNCTTPANCNVVPPPAPGGCNYLLKLFLTTQNWTYWATAVVGPPSTFIAYAQRQPGGAYPACQYSITQAQNEPVVAVGPCP